MVKRGLALILVIILFSTIVSALTSNDYYQFFGVKDFSGIIIKAILFIILALLIYRGAINSVFHGNQAASVIVAILLSFLMVKLVSESLTNIFLGITILAIIGILAWLISKLFIPARATPSRKALSFIIALIVLLIILFSFLRIGEFLGFKGVFDYPFFYQIGNYIDYFLQAEFFFDISQFFLGHGFSDVSIWMFLFMIIFVIFNIWIIFRLIKLLKQGKFALFLFWLFLYLVLLFMVFGYPTYFYSWSGSPFV